MMPFTRREQSLLLGLVVFATAWVLLIFAVRPAIDRMETLRRVIPEKTMALQQLRAKSKQYLTLKAGLDNLKKNADLQKSKFELLTFVESTTRKEGLTEKVTTMKQKVYPLDSHYSEIIVEVGLENLSIEQLLKFLLKIKSSNQFLQINSLYTKKSMANLNLLDSVIQISTLKSTEPIL